MIELLTEEHGKFQLDIPDNPDATEVWIAECDVCQWMPETAFESRSLAERWVMVSGSFHFINEKTICNECVLKGKIDV